MKPYGREKHVTGGTVWKKDVHVRKNGRKIENWWESICKLVPRSTMKLNCKRNINKDLSD